MAQTKEERAQHRREFYLENRERLLEYQRQYSHSKKYKEAFMLEGCGDSLIE